MHKLSLLLLTFFLSMCFGFTKLYRDKSSTTSIEPIAIATAKTIIDTTIDPRNGNSSISSCEKYIQENKERHIQELTDFLAIPSISSLPAHSKDMILAAEWLAEKLKKIGITSTEVVATKGHPIVLSHWNAAKGKPTVLIYGHYDVQPVNELDWTTPPFSAERAEGRIYARGAADDKGGIMIPIWAVEALLQKEGALPVNVIFVFDGEEEKGSPNFRQFLQQHKDLLKADYAYNADATQYNDSIPSIWMSLRGGASLEFTVKTANTDAHSGLSGGKTANSAKAAAQIISSLYTPENKLAAKGFYDRVLPLTKSERERTRKIPYDENKEKKIIGTTADIGESEYSPLERVWYRPTVEVTGIWGGYTAPEGFANIIPGATHVRLNCRLVPNQDGKEIIQLIKQHIEKHCPKGATVTFKEFDSYSSPIKFPATGSSFQYAYDILTKLYNRQPLLTAIGGSIGAMIEIKEILGLYAYSFGFQQTDENFHAPNEFIRLSDIEKGQMAYCMLLQHIADSKAK